jgi:integrase
VLDPGHLPAGAVPAGRAGARPAGAAGNAVCWRESTAAVLTGRTGGSGRIAAAQRDPAKRASALAMVVFGAGAGLRPGELVALRGCDVARHRRQVVAEISGPAARVVPVTTDYAGRAAALARHAGSGFVFRPGQADRGYKNFVTNFARTLVADPAAPKLTLSRCRSSFICGHLAAGTPLGELLAITGICQAESLARYARHVDGGPPKAALRAWDKTRRAR